MPKLNAQVHSLKSVITIRKDIEDLLKDPGRASGTDGPRWNRTTISGPLELLEDELTRSKRQLNYYEETVGKMADLHRTLRKLFSSPILAPLILPSRPFLVSTHSFLPSPTQKKPNKSAAVIRRRDTTLSEQQRLRSFAEILVKVGK